MNNDKTLTPLEAVKVLRDAIELHQQGIFNSDHPALAAAMRQTEALASTAAPERSGKLADDSDLKASGMVVKATFGDHHIIVPIGNANDLSIGTKLYARPAPADNTYESYMSRVEGTRPEADSSSAAPPVTVADPRTSSLDDIWSKCERISDIPAVDEALRGFSEDPTADNATCLVREILGSVVAPSPTGESLSAINRAEFIERVVLAVAEMDRDSPEDQPEMMLVSCDELKGILESAFEHENEAGTLATPRQTEDGGLNVGMRLHREDIASRLQGAINAAPGSDSAEVSKLTLKQAIAALASTFAPKENDNA